MRVKEIERTANVAWSPGTQFPIYMVAGTAAQQLDATFSTSAALEIYQLDLTDSSLSVPLISTVPSDCRFHKVVWGSNGMSASNPEASGVVVAGGDNSNIYCYDGAKMINGAKDSLLFKQDRHTGAVKALDFNPFQVNLLASGASESEIYIWDLNKPENPMTPGSKSQPPEDVACIGWNRQVQHILSSTFGSRCVVWDLRKNEPIIKISDSMSRIKCKMVCWHPDIATQLCLSSEDDHTPVIQLWDLRYATSPLKVLENHQKGVLDMAWCPQDPDLLLSCGKDNRILCWNPNSNVQGGEVVYELPTSNQWNFDVQWCPRNPVMISGCSFDGHVTIYSLMGGGHPVHSSDKIGDSFGINDPFNQAGASQQQQQQANVMPLQKPPKWLRKPVGASFGFGGKLVSFENTKTQNVQQPTQKTVYVSQVVTETDLLSRSNLLEQALENQQFVEYCAMKAANSVDSMQESIWNFLRVNFEQEPREYYIQLLGYDRTELARKDMLQAGLRGSGQASPSVGSKTPGSQDEALAMFDDISATQTALQQQKEERPRSPLAIPTSDDAEGLISESLLTGNFEAAVDVCLGENKMAEAILLAIAGGPELLSRTQKKYFQKNKSSLGRLISCVVTHNWTHLIETCDLENWKESLAIVLTYSSKDEFIPLCDTLARRLETEKDGRLSPYAGLCYICSGNIDKFVQNWNENTDVNNTPLSLQDLIEKVMILKRAVELSRGQPSEISGGFLAEKLNRYASLLAAQGSIDTAMKYLGNANEINLAILKDRIYQSLTQIPAGVQRPQFPFEKINVQAQGQALKQQPQQPERPSAKSYQTQAKSNFQTDTTPSAPYMNQFQSYQAVNGPTQTPGQGFYNPNTAPVPSGPQVSTTATTANPVSKGPLSHKYPSYPSTSSFGMDSYNQPSYYQPNSTMQPGYSQPNTYSGGASSYSAPLSTTQPTNMYNVMTPGAPSQPAANSNQPSMHSFMDHKPATAWNDPPTVKQKVSQKVPSQQSDVSAPITNPLYGTTQQQSQLPVQEQTPPGAPANYQNMYNPQEHQRDIQPAAAPVPEPKKPVVKDPIPAEHILSPNVVMGLHQIVQAIRQYDYNTGLQIYTQMVSQGNFSEISSFMPGLKVLLQSAMHLQVYVQ
ncbi:hypothetical protein KUTeg_004324 [Tegillarca granosa]|uniref:Protein transport protein Sec31A n=1 Tax=Tegillarca granosa TaxID=220873 RepID=A0ABQ9FPM9_TEGGR|nr:hypothetical protein KUTeg_004324 [Tegillarca granosa]